MSTPPQFRYAGKRAARLPAIAPDSPADAERAVDFLTVAKEITHWHHKNWDGSGYPAGLAGDAIPCSARLMALADILDALISLRVYKHRCPSAKRATSSSSNATAILTWMWLTHSLRPKFSLSPLPGATPTDRNRP